MTPHHPAADRPPCDACGAPSCLGPLQNSETATFYGKDSDCTGSHLCAKCWPKTFYENVMDIRARRKSLTPPASASEKWEPGHREACIAENGVTREEVRGEFLRFAHYKGSGGEPSYDSAVLRTTDGDWVHCDRATLRPAASAQRIESEPVCTCCHRTKATREDMRNNPLCSLCYDTGHIGGRPSTRVDCCHVKSAPTEQPPAPPATAKGDPSVWGITRSEADLRREGIERIQAIFNCPHNNDPGAHVDMVTRVCRSCGVSEMEFHSLRTHEPRGRSNYGAGGIDRRIATARASLESDGKARAAVSTHPRSWPAHAGETYELAATEGWSGR